MHRDWERTLETEKICTQAGEEQMRVVYTLERPKNELHRVWKASDEAKALAGDKLQLSQNAWSAHLATQQYESKMPCKRVDVCRTCLEFERQGVPGLSFAL